MKINTKKSYRVRIELEVDSIDLCNIEVEATSVEEAKKLAIEKWEDNPSSFDFNTWEADCRETRIDRNQIPDWEVEEV